MRTAESMMAQAEVSMARMETKEKREWREVASEASWLNTCKEQEIFSPFFLSFSFSLSFFLSYLSKSFPDVELDV